MLQSTDWSDSLCNDGTAPLEVVEIENKQIVKPVFAITATENEHLVLNNARRVELPHRRLAPNYAWNIEAQFVDTLFQVDEDHIGQHGKAIPATVYDNLTTVPHLRRVTHTWLRQLHFVDLGLVPRMFFCIKNENVVHDSLFAIAFTTSENDEVLSKLRT